MTTAFKCFLLKRVLTDVSPYNVNVALQEYFFTAWCKRYIKKKNHLQDIIVQFASAYTQG